MTQSNEMLFIGITGGVGAGKSSILNYIGSNYPCEIYLADEVAHEVKKKGTPCYKALVKLLGKEVLDENGQIDKGRMAAKIFTDGALLEKVNGLIHPAVKDYLMDKLSKAKKAGKNKLFFVEAALLIETGYGELVDEMWYVYAKRSVRIERLRENRGYSDEKIRQIMAAQLPDTKYREASDFVIDNSGDLEKACKRIDRKMKALGVEKIIKENI